MSSEAAVRRGVIPAGLLDPPLTEGLVTPGSLDDQVLAFPERWPPRQWYLGLAVTTSAMTLGFALIGYSIYTGIGVWGNTSPVFWGSTSSTSCSGSHRPRRT
jgi:molybdopterin-containing oxidoreductase family membrane subunit